MLATTGVMSTVSTTVFFYLLHYLYQHIPFSNQPFEVGTVNTPIYRWRNRQGGAMICPRSSSKKVEGLGLESKPLSPLQA